MIIIPKFDPDKEFFYPYRKLESTTQFLDKNITQIKEYIEFTNDVSQQSQPVLNSVTDFVKNNKKPKVTAEDFGHTGAVSFDINRAQIEGLEYETRLRANFEEHFNNILKVYNYSFPNIKEAYIYPQENTTDKIIVLCNALNKYSSEKCSELLTNGGNVRLPKGLEKSACLQAMKNANITFTVDIAQTHIEEQNEKIKDKMRNIQINKSSIIRCDKSDSVKAAFGTFGILFVVYMVFFIATMNCLSSSNMLLYFMIPGVAAVVLLPVAVGFILYFVSESSDKKTLKYEADAKNFVEQTPELVMEKICELQATISAAQINAVNKLVAMSTDIKKIIEICNTQLDYLFKDGKCIFISSLIKEIVENLKIVPTSNANDIYKVLQAEKNKKLKELKENNEKKYQEQYNKTYLSFLDGDGDIKVGREIEYKMAMRQLTIEPIDDDLYFKDIYSEILKVKF